VCAVSADQEEHVTTSENAQQPERGTDSRVEDWFGQSVERDAGLADRLTAEFGEKGAEAEFEHRARGEAEQEGRHGVQIDPDQGRSAYRDDST
jgi:hypothetical protein